MLDAYHYDVCDKIVALKNSIDLNGITENIEAEYFFNKTMNKGYITEGWSERKNKDFPVVCGDVFAKAIFPYLGNKTLSSVRTIDYINPHRVLGGMYYSIPKQDDEQWLMAELNKITKDNGNESALYNKIGSFDLYVPVEGKNRVSLFMRHNKDICAEIKVLKYPAPKDLIVYLHQHGLSSVSYIGDDKNFSGIIPKYQLVDRYRSIVAFPVTLQALELYGVKMEEKKLSVFDIYKFEQARMMTQTVVSSTFYIR